MANFKKTSTTKRYDTVGEIICDLSLMLSPPENLTVAQAAEKYRYINQPGAYIGPWKNSTVPYMVEPMNTFVSRVYNGMIFVGPAQSAKALDILTPIATPTGWATMGALSVGDTIFSDQGLPTKVTLATDVMLGKACYRVEFDDETSIIADADHKWLCYDDLRERSRVLNTQEMSKTFKYGARMHRNRYAIQNAKPLDLPEIELPIDPYTLGVWLGDGHAYSGQLCLRAEDMAPITERIAAAGHVIDARHDVTQNSYTVAIDPNPDNSISDTLRKRLRATGLLSTLDWPVGKRILPVYQRASITQRWALLQGLNDTDGTVANNLTVEFCTTDECLRDGYLQLCAGLGIKCHVRASIPTYTHKGEKREGKTAYKIAWTPSPDQRPFTLERQMSKFESRASVVKRPTHTGRRRITNVASVESRPVRCIQVDAPSHLFLAGRQMVPTHNTDSLVINTLAYSIKVDPMDMMVVCPTMLDGRDFGIRRIDRLHRHSESIGEMLLPTADADNRFDKQYTTGMLFTIAWPTPSQLAGKPIGRIVLTDRDRMPDDVDGDGEPFDLASKRTTTFGSYAMTVAESSPSREVTNLRWIPQSPHEAPPCEGILKLYNRGDRRRWVWPCPHCGEYFEGQFSHLTWDSALEGTNKDRAATVRMGCPHCGALIHPDDRDEMQFWGAWIKDGQGVDSTGKVFGPTPVTSIASFWLRGVAATFASWKTLCENYLNANDEYVRTGSEEALKKFYNNDLGEPYYPKSAHDTRLPEVLKARAEKMGERKVPVGVRFLIATIDVQKNMFVVQVHGILPGMKFDIAVIDRFEIRKSQRTDADGERLWVKPSTYVEDWDEITEHVIDKEYELDDDSGRMMSIRFVGCDSGGRAGVTSMAYSYYRKLRELNKHRRFILLKGDALPNQPRARITYPDSVKKDMKAGARGDIPLLILNSNNLKDDLDGRLDCIEPRKGMVRFPEWLSDTWFAELCAEIRTDKGWVNANGNRNESWDLLYYCIGLCVSELLRVEGLNWEDSPGWASDWHKNDLVREADKAVPFANPLKSGYDFAKFGEALA